MKKSSMFWGINQSPLVIQYLAATVKVEREAEVVVETSSKGQKTGKTQSLEVIDSGVKVNLTLRPLATEEIEIESKLKSTSWVRIRDAMGTLVANLERLNVQAAEIDLKMDRKLLPAALTGLEIALYRYRRVRKTESPKFKLSLKHQGRRMANKDIEPLCYLGQAVNLARHLTNLPPNELNPVTYAEFAQGLLAKRKDLRVEVWEEGRLRKENMTLLLEVGRASGTPPRLVHLRYRPKGAKGKPIALVGKGITFDTGGIDIKPSSGMRLMKKDMGGSAAVLGVMSWAVNSGLKVPLDGYLTLAENAVDGHGFRPSDVITARNGLAVEIHNTDAEGRLALADAIDVAVTDKEKPHVVVDVATLTGAIKVALGSQLAGLFSNQSDLAQKIASAGQEVGELSWIMPLFRRYRASMNSNFADLVNSVDGFGGAVTAALFLEKFVRDVPWAHLDIYAWKDSSDGCWLESGGSGQSVLNLAQWLSHQSGR